MTKYVQVVHPVQCVVTKRLDVSIQEKNMIPSDEKGIIPGCPAVRRTRRHGKKSRASSAGVTPPKIDYRPGIHVCTLDEKWLKERYLASGTFELGIDFFDAYR